MSNNATFTGMPATQFFDEYPVVQVGGTGATVWKPSTIDKEGFGDLQVVSSNTRISYATFAAWNDPMGIGSVTTPANRQPTSLKITANNPGGAIPVFYLPYALNHNRRLTLVDKQGIGAVDFFVTDLVDGCSVYVEGTPAQPSVYHINANKQKPKGMKDLSPTMASSKKMKIWNSKWSQMDQRFKTEGTVVKALGGTHAPPLPNVQAASKVESQDYMLLTANQESAFSGMLAGMQATQRCPQNIGGQSVDELEVIFSQGTIFGTRVGLNWSFWVQKRVLVKLYHLTLVPPASRTTKQKAAAAFGKLPYTRTQLGTEWVIRGVHQFGPTVNTGRLVP